MKYKTGDLVRIKKEAAGTPIAVYVRDYSEFFNKLDLEWEYCYSPKYYKNTRHKGLHDVREEDLHAALVIESDLKMKEFARSEASLILFSGKFFEILNIYLELF